jgi:hypothetical protein
MYMAKAFALGLANMIGKVAQPRTPPRTPKRLERSEAWQSQKKLSRNTNFTVFALGLGRLFESSGIHRIWHKGACSELRCYPPLRIYNQPLDGLVSVGVTPGKSSLQKPRKWEQKEF